MTTKVAIVTGASSGIGEVTARRLQNLGYTVYAAARRVERMAPLAEVGVRPVAVDVTDDASMVGLVDRVIAETGRVDVLVNSAGYGSLGAVEDVGLSEARRQFDVNLFGLARLTQLVLPHMRSQRCGHIINISSIGGKMSQPLSGWYHSTKFAVEGLSDSLRMELAPFGIHVVVIEPGSIRTEWSGIAADNLVATSARGAYAGHAATIATLLRNPGMGSSPDVIANAVAKAVTSRRPRTRYVVGMGAKPILFARRHLSDRGFDRLTALTYRVAGQRSERAAAPPAA
ncbi:MAG: short-chain dehydrogenase/reductase [Chloroflexi bacterium]|jgi:NAD(P)-dependent dehydrogenase (short-subunit alcohol dehydrogenase family)|nr:short-chain dehydrogenase/reductase [Chloroflexota bacterium]